MDNNNNNLHFAHAADVAATGWGSLLTFCSYFFPELGRVEFTLCHKLTQKYERIASVGNRTTAYENFA